MCQTLSDSLPYRFHYIEIPRASSAAAATAHPRDIPEIFPVWLGHVLQAPAKKSTHPKEHPSQC